MTVVFKFSNNYRPIALNHSFTEMLTPYMNNFNHVIDYNDKSHKTINSDYDSGYQGAGDRGGGM